MGRLKLWLLMPVCLLLLGGQALAAEQLPRRLLEVAPEAAAAMERAQSGQELLEGAGEMVERAVRDWRGRAASGAGRCAMLAAGVVLLGLVEVLSPRGGESVSRGVTLAGALWITAVSAGEVDALIGMGRETVEQLALVSKFLLPALAASVAAGGGVTAAAVHQTASAFFSDLLLSVMDALLLPGVYLYVALAAASAVLEGELPEKLANLLKKGLTWMLCTLLGAYTAFLALGGAVAEAADRTAAKAAGAVVKVAVPVVGGILSEAMETVLSGAGVLRGALGSFGALAVLSICLTPVLRLGGQYLLYQGASLAVECAGPKKLGKLLAMLSNAFALVLAMTAAAALLLIISLTAALRVVSI